LCPQFFSSGVLWLSMYIQRAFFLPRSMRKSNGIPKYPITPISLAGYAGVALPSTSATWVGQDLISQRPPGVDVGRVARTRHNLPTSRWRWRWPCGSDKSSSPDFQLASTPTWRHGHILIS